MRTPGWLRRSLTVPPYAAEAPGARGRALSAQPVLWAQAQTQFWAARTLVSATEYADALDRLNRERHDIYVFDLDRGDVKVREKHVHHPAAFNRRIEHFRVHLYRDHLRQAAARSELAGPVSVAVGVGDLIRDVDPRIPVFVYQKRRDEPWLLLPDVEMLEFDFHAEETPDVALAGKLDRIVFSGASTGRPLDEEAVRRDDSERLRFASHFVGHPHIEYSIGRASECQSPEAQALLEAKPYFRMFEWHEQVLRRYILSMDGNGATCSRVVRTLRSRSCLIKLNSENILFYFPGLAPWTHFIPIVDETDLERLAPLLVRPDYPSDAICDAANTFCRDSLSREAVVGYTAALLQGFREHYLLRI